jgi:hypothetical protein
VNLDSTLAFDPGFSRQVRHLLEGLDIFLTAIGIAAVIELIGAEKNILGGDTFGETQSKSKKDRVARRHIGRRNAVTHFPLASVFGNLDAIGERRAADGAQVEINDQMLVYANKGSDFLGGLELAHMTLPIAKAHGVQRKTLFLGQRRGRSGVKTAAQ